MDCPKSTNVFYVIQNTQATILMILDVSNRMSNKYWLEIAQNSNLQTADNFHNYKNYCRVKTQDRENSF